MTAPDLSPAEAAVVARFEEAPDAPESLRVRVADAIWYAANTPGACSEDAADAALAVITKDARA